MPSVPHDKAREYLTVLRHTLLGRNYHQAARALEVMLDLHQGTRKDNVTPEWAHPALVTLHLITLDGSWPAGWADDLYAASILHDTLEDKKITREELQRRAQLSDRALRTIIAVSRKERAANTSVDKTAYYLRMDAEPLAAPIKLADRAHNFDSMIGVFTSERQLEYLEEAQGHILPMAKRARRQWPELYFPLQNLTQHLKGQVNLIRALHGQ